MRIIPLSILALAIAATGCSTKSDDDAAHSAAPSAAKPPPPPPPAVTAPPTAAVAPKPPAELKLASVGNTMAFDLTALTVAAGQSVHLVFKNNSTMDALPHNWILVKTGQEAAVAAAGLKAGPTGNYLVTPDPNILAFTPLAAKGATVEVTFTAPAAGTYPYICTVPGHYMKMKGVLTVTP